MAFHFFSAAKTEIPLGRTTAKQFLQLAAASAKHLGWQLAYVHDDYLIADTPDRRMLGETVSILVEDGVAKLKSESRAGKFYHSKGNQQNIDSLRVELEARMNNQSPPEVQADSGTYSSEQEHSTLKELHNQSERRQKSSAFSEENIPEWLVLFVPHKGYMVTPILIDINILVFLAMCISGAGILSPDTDALVNWGANYRSYAIHGEWWRLVSACFVHIGIAHLLFNMYALLLVSIELEPLVGSLNYACLYFFTGILSSLASIGDHPMVVSAGASGAIFGLFGVYLALLTTNLVEKQKRYNQLISFGVLIVYNLGSGSKGIDMAAHFAGLCSGLIMGYLMLFTLHRPHSILIKVLSLGLLGWFSIGFSMSSLKTMPDVEKIYDTSMDDFTRLEKSALSIYSLPDTINQQQRVQHISNDGLRSWDSAAVLLKYVDTLALPDDLHDRVHQLQRYTQLRQSSTRFYFKAYNENTNVYDDSLASYRTKIHAVLDTINGKIKTD